MRGAGVMVAWHGQCLVCAVWMVEAKFGLSGFLNGFTGGRQFFFVWQAGTVVDLLASYPAWCMARAGEMCKNSVN